LFAPFWVKVCLLLGATADLTILSIRSHGQAPWLFLFLPHLRRGGIGTGLNV
jgi:hypothetical protein